MIHGSSQDRLALASFGAAFFVAVFDGHRGPEVAALAAQAAPQCWRQRRHAAPEALVEATGFPGVPQGGAAETMGNMGKSMEKMWRYNDIHGKHHDFERCLKFKA